MSHPPPFVLIIDDDPQGPDRALVSALETAGIEALLTRPNSIDEEDLNRASVIAVDHYLREWPERDRQPVGLAPQDGIALCSILRSKLELPAYDDPTHRNRPVAFVIRTNRMELLRAHLPKVASEHLIASANGLEWVQPKYGKDPDEAVRLVELATAVTELPHGWAAPATTEPDEIAEWLGLKDTLWYTSALQQVEDCRPTVHLVAQHTGGTGFLRWFLQRILPFPTFLIGDVRAGLALGLQVSAFRVLAAGDTPWSARVAECRYDGHLSSFSGRRWWRAGIQALAWEFQAERRTPIELLADLGLDPGTALVDRGAVVVLDEDLEPTEQPVNIDDAVRIVPDGWPSFAEDAWASLQLANQDSQVRALVVSADRAALRDPE